jgi:hypothetical protein
MHQRSGHGYPLLPQTKCTLRIAVASIGTSETHTSTVAGVPALKPEIPAVSAYGIPMRDEIDLEKAAVNASAVR